MLERHIQERSNTDGPVLGFSEANHQGLKSQNSGVLEYLCNTVYFQSEVNTG